MISLVVLSAFVAVSVAAPNGIVAPLLYSNPQLSYIQSVPVGFVGAAPRTISQQSSSVVHSVGVPVVAAPVVAQAPVVVAPATKSISSQSSTVIHKVGSPSIVAPIEPQVELVNEPIVEAEPVLELKSPLFEPSPIFQYASPISSYSTHGLVNSAGYIAPAPVVEDLY